MQKHNNSGKKSEPTSKRTKSRGPVQRDTKEVLAELVGKLKEKLDPKRVAARSAGEKHQSGELRPNLDRLTVGVDLGDQGSHYCILGLEGETLAEGQLRTTQEDLATFFQGLNGARVVVEVGTHSAWVQEVLSGCGHEVLVANPRLMDGSKRRKRKNDRIDANKLARLGRVDPESLYPIQHRSREVRQDLVMLRARDALVAARTEIINTTRGLVKSMGTRLPKCSSRLGCRRYRRRHRIVPGLAGVGPCLIARAVAGTPSAISSRNRLRSVGMNPLRKECNFYHNSLPRQDGPKYKGRPTAIRSAVGGKIRSFPRLGGLHHLYAVAA